MSDLWYPIQGLRRNGYVVIFHVAGHDLQGYRRRHKKPKPVVSRQYILPNGEAVVREDWETMSYVTYNEDGHTEDLPKWLWPAIFRPVDPARYPDKLPDAIVRRTPKGFEPAQASPPAPPLPKMDLTIRVYSPSGNIERGEVEIRAIRALRTARLMPWVIQAKLQTGLGFLADWAKSGEETIAINDPTPKWEPTGADIDDAQVVMGWFVQLNPPEMWPSTLEAAALARLDPTGRNAIEKTMWTRARKPDAMNSYQEILAWRALDPPMSWAEIARTAGMGDRYAARRHYDEALEKLWRAANGLPVFSGTTDQMQALRERNRLHRQREGV